MTVPELRKAMTSYIRPEDDLAAEAEVLVERGWLTRDAEDRLWLTRGGGRGPRRPRTQRPAIRAALHEGIEDTDYITTVKVLQQLIGNAGGTAA